MKKLLLYLLPLFIGVLSNAQSDTQEGATVLDESNNYTISNSSTFSSKTRSEGAISCDDDAGDPIFGVTKDVWYQFEATSTEVNFFGQRPISNSFTYEVFDSENNELACENGFINPGPEAMVNFNLTNLNIGETYFIRAGIGFLGTSSFEVRVTPVNLTSINSLSSENEIELFPNPTTDYLNLENVEGDLVRIVSTNGIVIKEVNVSDNKLDVSDLSNGVYTIEIITNDKINRTTFTKE